MSEWNDWINLLELGLLIWILNCVRAIMAGVIHLEQIAARQTSDSQISN